jgi:hypothetical protein
LDIPQPSNAGSSTPATKYNRSDNAIYCASVASLRMLILVRQNAGDIIGRD